MMTFTISAAAQDNPPPERRTANAKELERLLVDEALIALGFPPHGWARRILGPIVKVPVGRFGRLAAEFDARVADSGIASGSHWLWSQHIASVDAQGADRIPATGPVLIASNHPGAYDVVIILSSLPRDDVKVVVSGVPFAHALTATSKYFIPVTDDTRDRMTAVRAMIRQLQAGGALLIFPSGYVDPDPALQPGAEEALEKWSPSLDLLLRSAPETRVVSIIVSGVLARECLNNPLTRLTKADWEKRKLAEFLQLSQTMAFGRRFALRPHVIFGEAIPSADLYQGGVSESALPAIISNAQSVLKQLVSEQPTVRPSPKTSGRSEMT